MPTAGNSPLLRNGVYKDHFTPKVMILHPEKALVFASISADSIDLEIYRLLYPNSSHELIFMDGEYRSTDEMKNYVLPADDGEVLVNGDDLITFLREIENVTRVRYDCMGIFYEFDLGFNFTKSMIDEITSRVEVNDTLDLEKALSEMSYVDEEWFLIDWENSLPVLIDNLNFILDNKPDPEVIGQTISESVELKKMQYPEIFEVLLYAGDLYSTAHVYLRNDEKVFCVKTTSNGPYPNFIYDRNDFDENLIDPDNSTIIDLDVILMNKLYDSLNDPLSDSVQE